MLARHLNKKQTTCMRGSRENNYACEETSKKRNQECARDSEKGIWEWNVVKHVGREWWENINSSNFFLISP